MKAIRNLLRKLANPVVLGVAALAFLSTVSQAATVRMWVRAKNTTWARIIPNSNLGGRVIWSAEYGDYITDRATRGEWVYATISASTPAERVDPKVRRCWLFSRSAGSSVALPLYWANMWTMTYNFQAPLSPFWDYNRVNVDTVSGTFGMDLPIGTRP